MKTSIVILAVLSVFCASLVKGLDKKAIIAEVMAKADECKAEVGASEADLSELVAKQPASTPEGKCLRSCMMMKFGVMDASGKFVKSVAVGHAEKCAEGDADKLKTANEIIDACAGISVSNDPCEAAEQYGKCFKTEAEAHGISNFQI